jgi:hypothetical protein
VGALRRVCRNEGSIKQLPLLRAALAARKAKATPSNQHLAQTAKAA